MKSKLILNISNYLNKSQDHFHRYNSWNHCFTTFGNPELNRKELSLNLGFYLASWGMYRGSSQLLHKDFLVHEGAVKHILAKQQLRSGSNKEIDKEDLDDLKSVIQDLKIYCAEVNVSPTDTLISKILLGTLGCLPAFDRYFVAGVKSDGFEFKSLSEDSLEELFLFYEDNAEELREIQKQELAESTIFYPRMKLIDMYFWERGSSTYKL